MYFNQFYTAKKFRLHLFLNIVLVSSCILLSLFANRNDPEESPQKIISVLILVPPMFGTLLSFIISFIPYHKLPYHHKFIRSWMIGWTMVLASLFLLSVVAFISSL